MSLNTLTPTIRDLQLNRVSKIRSTSIRNLFKNCECLFLLWGGESDWNANYYCAFKTKKDEYFTFTTYSCSNCQGSSEIDDYGGYVKWVKDILPTKIKWYDTLKDLIDGVKEFDIQPYYEEYAKEVNTLGIEFFIKGDDMSRIAPFLTEVVLKNYQIEGKN